MSAPDETLDPTLRDVLALQLVALQHQVDAVAATFALLAGRADPRGAVNADAGATDAQPGVAPRVLEELPVPSVPHRPAFGRAQIPAVPTTPAA